MDSAYWIALRVLVNKYCKGKESQCIHAFPKEHAEKLMKIPVASDNLTPLINLPERSIHRYHYSWLNEIITEKLPKELKKATILSLPEHQKIPLMKLNFKTVEDTPPAEPIKQFLLMNLSKHLVKKSLLPVEYLPPGDLNFLLEMTKSQLCEMIDYLAIYDLSHEVKKVVDRRILQNITDSLKSPFKQQFLKVCMQKKEMATSHKPMLKGWMGDPQRFMKILHSRGLQKLSYAIAGQSPSFVRQLSYLLDVGRGKILLKYYSKKPIPKVTPILIQQISRIMEFFNSKRVVK